MPVVDNNSRATSSSASLRHTEGSLPQNQRPSFFAWLCPACFRQSSKAVVEPKKEDNTPPEAPIVEIGSLDVDGQVTGLKLTTEQADQVRAGMIGRGQQLIAGEDHQTLPDSIKQLLDAHTVDRTSLLNGDSLMFPSGHHGIVKKDTPFRVQFTLDEKGVAVIDILPGDTEVEVEPRTFGDKPPSQVSVVEADWVKHDDLSLEQKQLASGKGNVFGGNGLFLTKEPFAFDSIDIRDVDEGFLNYFGIQIITPDKPTPTMVWPADGVIMGYQFSNSGDNRYLNEYVLQEEGGNGAFIETHPFSHVFITEKEGNVGKIVVGRKLDESHFAFSQVNIPFGYGIYLPRNTIHTDSASEGSVIVGFTEGVQADTVLIKQRNGEVFNPFQ